jgi:two-component system, OmpR family, response regulator ChvI
MDSQKKIAIIDDEKSIQRTLAYALRAEGYGVDVYDSGLSALERLNGNPPDLIILDIMMPGIDGITFCSLFRREDRKTPVIFLTSRADELSRLEALERGGDDFLTKPFSIKELVVRISVCLRRVALYGGATVSAEPGGGDSLFAVDFPAWQVRVNGRIVDFTVTEFRIFTALHANPGAVMTREKLMEHAYPQDPYVSDRNADMHITRIRKKICALEPGFDGIKTVYGLGYRFKESGKGGRTP